ncbi:MAG: hypothetical protein AAFR90_02715 [Pseudomonadota bacterium]
MAKAVELKESMSADQFRAETAKTKDPNQTRRLLALDAIRDGKSQASGSKPAAWIPRRRVTGCTPSTTMALTN